MQPPSRPPLLADRTTPPNRSPIGGRDYSEDIAGRRAEGALGKMAARALPDHQLIPLAVHHQGGVRQDLVGDELPADQGLHGVLEEAA